MKKILFISFFISFKMFGQSLELSPTSLSRIGGFSNDIEIYKNSSDFPTIVGYRSGGTQSQPTGTTSGMQLLVIGAGGFFGSLHTSKSSILFSATQDWKANSYGTKMTFNTTSNNTSSPNARMVIDHDGKVGIGISSPNQILDINGRMRIRHTPGYTSGVWMSNSTNGLGDGDGAFIGLNTDTQAGIYIGNAWRFGFNSNGNAVITGFTQLGNSTPAGADASKTAPAIKTLKLTGTTAATQGGTVSIPHGLPFSKILSVTALVTIGNFVFPPNVDRFGVYKYSTYFDDSFINISNDSNLSSDILSKPFKILIIYEE